MKDVLHYKINVPNAYISQSLQLESKNQTEENLNRERIPWSLTSILFEQCITWILYLHFGLVRNVTV